MEFKNLSFPVGSCLNKHCNKTKIPLKHGKRVFLCNNSLVVFTNLFEEYLRCTFARLQPSSNETRTSFHFFLGSVKKSSLVKVEVLH